MSAHLPVESSWRMVEGANDSFDTSIVPTSFSQESDAGLNHNESNEGKSNDDPFASSGSVMSSSQPPFYSPPSLGSTDSRLAVGMSSQDTGGGDSFAAGSDPGSGSAGASQEDDIHTFLRKAELDTDVLLRSPFQPSLPSSVRQSPMSGVGRTYHPPELRMPVVEMDGSLHSTRGDHGNDSQSTGVTSKASSLAAAVLRRRGGSRLGRVSSASDDATQPAGSTWSRVALVFTLSLLAACGALAIATASPSTYDLLRSIPSGRLYSTIYSTAASAICAVPGASVSLAACSLSSSRDTHISTALHRPDDPEEPVSLVRSAGDLMRAQNHLAAIVRTRVLPSRYRNAAPVAGRAGDGLVVVPPAHDAWRVPRTRTKDLLATARMQQQSSASSHDPSGTGAALLLLELEAYLEAARRVSVALSRLHTGAAATAAESLVYNTRRTMAQLQRMYEQAKASGASHNGAHAASNTGWASRLLSPSTQTSASRRRALLADVYRHHTETLLAKTSDRVSDARAVLAELEAASRHLSTVQQYVDARIRAGSNTIGSAPDAEADAETHDTNATSNPFGWLWRLVARPGSAPDSSTPPWMGYAEQLDALRHEHDASVRRAGDALDELADVQDALVRLQARLGSKGAKAGSVTWSSDDLDLNMRLHLDIVDAGIYDLEAM